VEEMNLQNNHEQYLYSMKEKFFEKIVSESRILDAISNEENDESILRMETPHPIKDNNILEQPIIDYIETFFESVVLQEIPTCSQHIWFNLNTLSTYPSYVALASICFRILELIPKIRWILEWLHWKYTYT
jgi:hypothetical protein